ncbi:cytochrome c oxidase accessory protein CcoG [Thioalkalivibrio sulfidiphilus HL-EbGr7]|uniref:Cytochrome c oxidase accessory protein CcoG n=1 Tax=Thioalkalivibrio sulfidiphilus (strain HL-EbGR7) TaxID=396588 RepID=B8GLX7_THISH|nr:cytochrome c oxidase accessory protein CcoG [Thioalkalivibrio sulfidiphilus]ACL71730.1 cytochrome c oxidase accessory protein CcoG [Thioalkalivibrio sulfidiphilus HL-EbGr7]
MSKAVTPPEGNEQEFYAKRAKVYPREVHGLFARLRTAGVLGLLGIFYGAPWLTWGDRQAIWFDLPGRKFHVIGWTFWPQDFFLLALLLIIAALSLFFFTTLAGRLWCGYACPQTVWTEAFLWIERRIEGDRSAQMKLDKAPWGGRKLVIKGTKHTIWLVFALFTGLTFVGYFTPIAELMPRFFTFQTGGWETFWILFYGFATWGNAGFMREQVCIYMCPYARFQSAMFDRDTLIISYDENRGEPRGSRKRGVDPKQKGLGDCIDCTLCVQVCPTGIDIRDGLQYQCIGCAACVDVCDQVMDKMGYPRGLVRYTTENAMEGKVTKVLRPRVVLYALLLLVLMAGLLYGIMSRNPVGIDVIRDRNVLFRELADGRVENVYTLKLLNKSDSLREYHVEIRGLEGAELVIDRVMPVPVPAGGVVELPARVRLDPVVLDAPTAELVFIARVEGEPDAGNERAGRFVGRMR